ncbi:protein phosphatase 1 regulatory subunit 15B [Brienomyrus brachyistius]|uniref:protein phosphatase 1 regulatory subunit 15B n=1 Tax=Brienomyrus brachyistius TaxID=42636 RepID=UPI0020B376B4|nr:protein phosphatase 1 regulatory subunit 15B [Brienomyrus brachyistius]
MNSDRLSSKHSATSTVPDEFGVASLVQKNQESSWFGFLSVVFRPALSFAKKYLPGRLQTPTLLNGGFGSINEDISRSVDGDSSFLERLGKFIPAAEHHPHIAYLHYQHEASGFDFSSKESVRWISAESFHELGINPADVDLNVIRDTTGGGYLAAAKHFLSQFLISAVSSQNETRTAEQMLSSDGWPADLSATKNNWQGEIWGSELSDWKEKVSATWFYGENTSDSQQVKSSTVVSVARPTKLFVQCKGSVHSEHTGLFCHAKLAGNGASCMSMPGCLLSTEISLLDYQPVYTSLINTRTVAACQSDVAVLTPDQDNGYTSLEEEHSNTRLHVMRPLCLNKGCIESGRRTEVQGCSIEEEPKEAKAELTEWERHHDSVAKSEEGELPVQEEVEVPAQSYFSKPKCQNKTIAYIMGSPCSEDSDSESEGDCDWDDDDGFDSEGASDFSDSEDCDSDDEEDAEDANAGVEKLWNSFCQSRDRYNLWNFTAPLKTAADPVTQANVSVMAVEAERSISPSSFSSFSSSLKPLIEEDNSGDESGNVDKADSLHLWNSFSCVSDPYSLLNFQAPLRTLPAARSFSGTSFTSPCSHKKEAEERLDSGFSEDVASHNTCSAKLKKVRFVEDVEEFYASCDEDRRSPWEEFARDRCRFLRRVQETEDVIGYCLAPDFRQLIFQRLHQSC